MNWKVLAGYAIGLIAGAALLIAPEGGWGLVEGLPTPVYKLAEVIINLYFVLIVVVGIVGLGLAVFATHVDYFATVIKEMIEKDKTADPFEKYRKEIQLETKFKKGKRVVQSIIYSVLIAGAGQFWLLLWYGIAHFGFYVLRRELLEWMQNNDPQLVAIREQNEKITKSILDD